MANFTLSPTAGTGSYYPQYVTVTPTNTNTGRTDKVTVATVNVAGGSKDVVLTHYGVPSITPALPVMVGASGQTLEYTIHTHYPFSFDGVPSWIRITDSNNVTYDSGEIYNASLAEGTTFYFTVSANTTSVRRASNGFLFKHIYSGSSYGPYTQEISITQESGTTSMDIISTSTPNLTFDWDSSGDTLSVTVSSNVSWTAALENGSHFAIVGSTTGASGNTTLVVKVNDINPMSSTIYKDKLTVTGGTVRAEVSIEQLRQPRFTCLDDGGDINIDPNGETLRFDMTSDYNWWFETVSGQSQYPAYSPMYMTMTDPDNPSFVVPTSQGTAAVATPSGKTYNITWTPNNGNVRMDSLNTAYTKKNGNKGYSYRNFSTTRQTYMPATAVTISPTTDNVTYGPSVRTATVISNHYSWDIETDVDWIEEGTNWSGGTGSTTMTYEITENYGNSARTGHVYVIANGQTAATLTVNQAYNEHQPVDYLTATPGETMFNEKSGYTTVVVSASTDWVVASTPDWITIRKYIFDISQVVTSGTSGTTTVYAHRLTNSGLTSRTGTVTFSSTTATADITFTQSGYTPPTPGVDFITCSPSAFNETMSASSVYLNNVVISASTDWVVTYQPEWFSLRVTPFATDPVTGGTAGEVSLKVKIEENTGGTRNDTMTLQAGTATTTLYVSQRAAGII